MKRTVIAVLLLSYAAAFGQQPTVITNVVTAHPAFRIVKGQLYNTELSTNFATVKGQCLAVLSNGVIVQQFEIRRTYQEFATNLAQVIAAVSGAPAPLIKEEYVPVKKIFVRNYPSQPLAEIGSPILARAMRDGIFNYQSELIELWDYGTPHRVVMVTTNKAPNNLPKAGFKEP